MVYSIREDAHAVLFPAFDGVSLSDAIRQFLDQGGVSILLGESRDEYVARSMSTDRRKSETAVTFQQVTSHARSRSGVLLAAVDQELGGICRLHDLAPAFPDRDKIEATSPDEIEKRANEVALAARQLGINLFLSPVVDVLDGPNYWLQGRTWSSDTEMVGRLSAAYVRGVQSANVAATAKHFPGFRSITGDPAIEAHAECLTSEDALDAGMLPFRDVIEADVDVVMVGPAIVRAFDPDKAALRSASVVERLTKHLGFRGVVMADDLDSKATMRGDSVADVALDALNAGCDFLLLADLDDQVSQVAKAIEAAAASGQISRDRLASSAQKIRNLAERRA